MRIVLKAHAKLNLDLRVLDRREDGYHELRTIFQTIALHDTVVIEETPRQRFSLVGDGSTMPLDASNLAWKAAAALWKALGRKGEPAGVRIDDPQTHSVAGGAGRRQQRCGSSTDRPAASMARVVARSRPAVARGDARCGRAVLSLWRYGSGPGAGRRRVSADRSAAEGRGHRAAVIRRFDEGRLRVAVGIAFATSVVSSPTGRTR